MDRLPITLIGVGDVMIARHDETLLDPAAPVLKAADIVFGNCEWPYSDLPFDIHPVEAHLNDGVEGDELFTPGDPESLRMVGRNGFNVMSLANNHSMHAGYRAFLRTMEVMRESSVAPVGGGRDIAEAQSPVFIERKGTTVGFVGCTSAMLPGAQAGRRTPGVAPLRRHSYFRNPNWNDWGLEPQVGTLVDRDDLEAVCASIRAARARSDVVVVSVHWGLVEDRLAIGDYQRQAAHAFIDEGADLILGHGTLVTKGIEIYKGKAIFYSLGKFLMKGSRPTDEVPIGVTAAFGKDARKGMAALVDIQDGRIVRVGFAPTFADERTRPAFLTSDAPMFAEIAEEIRAVGAAAGLNPDFAVEADRVIVS